jgi:DNA-binding MarR family transcriptional regulator
MTPAGKQKLREILPEHRAMTGRMLRGLTQAEQKTLHELLCRIDDTLNEDED